MFESLLKAIVGAVIVTPVSVVADVVTVGGQLTDRDKTYTGEAVEKVIENLNKAVE